LLEIDPSKDIPFSTRAKICACLVTNEHGLELGIIMDNKYN